MIPNIHNQDEIIRTLRLIQQAGFKSAVIAGGAVRDLYFDILPSDIDIFVWDPKFSDESTSQVVTIPPHDKESWSHILKLKKSQRIGGDSIDKQLNNYGKDEEKITAIWNVIKNFIPYQIITTQINPIQYVDRYFDIGLCKAYCDGRKFRFTNDFFIDMTNQTLTIVGQNMTQQEYDYAIEHHIPKIQRKYPNYTVRVAPWNQKFVEKM